MERNGSRSGRTRGARSSPRSRSAAGGRAASCSTSSITLAHGAGGQGHPRAGRGGVPPRAPQPAARAARRQRAARRRRRAALAFTTDSFVVTPLFFPGGDIGELAVNGTVNDLAMAGARPLALSAGVHRRGGLPGRRPAADRRLDGARPREAAASRSPPATPRSSSAARRDGLYINTVRRRRRSSTRSSSVPPRSAPGDRVLVSGTIGDHGMAIMVARGELELEVELE